MSSFELYSPEINEILDEYGSLSLFVPKHKINQILETILKSNKSDNVYYFTDHQSSSSFEKLSCSGVHYHFLIEFLLLVDKKYSHRDLILIDLVHAYSLNFGNPMAEQITDKIKRQYFKSSANDSFLEPNNSNNPLFIFIVEEDELHKDSLYVTKEQQRMKNPLKYMATHFAPIQAYLYKNSPFSSDVIEFFIQKPNTDINRLWYPCQSNARFTQNELRKKAFDFLPGKIDPEMVMSDFGNYHDELWPFIFSLIEIKDELASKKINPKLWSLLWKKANEDGESFNPEVYNNWWFVHHFINEKNVDQQRKILYFEHYASFKKMGKRKIQILAEILIKIPETRRYNLMRYWSRSDNSHLDQEEVHGLIEGIPDIYSELTEDIKNRLDYAKISSWEKLHDYLSDQQSLLDYGILPIESQVALKFMENKKSDFQCIIPYTPPEIKKLGKVFHNCLFSFTARVQKGEVSIVTFFDDHGQNLCVAFHYSKQDSIIHFEQALAKDNHRADSDFVNKAKSYILQKIQEQNSQN